MDDLLAARSQMAMSLAFHTRRRHDFVVSPYYYLFRIFKTNE